MADDQLRLAREIRRNAEGVGHDPAMVIAEIQRRGGVSLLRAHRLYHGMSTQDVAERLGADRTSIGRWETGKECHSRGHIDGLCRLYRTGPVELGLLTDYSTIPGDSGQQRPRGEGIILAKTDEKGARDDEDMKRRALLAGLVAAPALDTLEEVRRRAQKSLASTTVTTADIDGWEQAAESYGTRVLTSPPIPFLEDLGADFAEIAAHMQHRQPTQVQQDLAHAAARFAGLIAGTFCGLGENRLARHWWTTAQTLAEESGDSTVRGWVLGEKAVHGLYQGHPFAGVVRLARQAQHLTAQPRAETARAVAAEAQALAREGRRRDAAGVVQRTLEPLFARLPRRVTSDHSIYGWPEFRLGFVRSYVYTVTGQTRLARQAQTEALPLYPAGHYGSSTNIRLHQAAVLVHEGDPDHGTRYATDILTSLPKQHRINSVLATADMVLDAVPDRARTLPAVTDLRELLATDRRSRAGRGAAP